MEAMANVPCAHTTFDSFKSRKTCVSRSLRKNITLKNLNLRDSNLRGKGEFVETLVDTVTRTLYYTFRSSFESKEMRVPADAFCKITTLISLRS